MEDRLRGRTFVRDRGRARNRGRGRRKSPRAAAFTLIEMLVVIAIIALLASITIPVMSSVSKKQKATETTNLIARLKMALQQYNEAFGDYPPSSPRVLKLSTNGVNDGIKCLVRCLTSTRKPGNFSPFEFEEKVLINVCGDKLGNPKVTGSSIAKPDNWEVSDGFYQPLIYLHNMDYEKGQFVQLVDGAAQVKVKGVKSEKTGQYEGLTSYQLWSGGFEGHDVDGKLGELCSWK
ncbi:type II secretion system protein [bacterium]|nr:type II secretion system protein [bacterium]